MISKRVAALPAATIGLFTVVWAVLRALQQAITLDEADTYLSWVAPLEPNYWLGHSNNHLLNSALIRLATEVFGASSFTVRLPALVGGCAYVGACFVLSGCLARNAVSRGIVMACLVWNPYLSDYYVAARGYGLALGLWASAVAVVATVRFRQQPPEGRHVRRAWVVASTLLALAFSANFPYAFLCGATWIGLFAWLRRGHPFDYRLFAEGALAACAIVILVPSWTLLHWPKGELWHGTHSVRETVESVVAASTFQSSSETGRNAAPYLIPTVTMLAFCYAPFVFRRQMPPAAELSLLAAGIGFGALGVHWLAFRSVGLLMPKARMAAYLIPCWTLAVTALAVAAPRRLPTALVRAALLGALAVLAVFYATCQRREYFYEWFWNADAWEAYQTIARYSEEQGVVEVPSRSPMTSCFEFYRLTGGNSRLRAFQDPQPYPNGEMPPGKDLYAVFEASDREFVEREHLAIIYRGRVFGDFVIAARPR